MKKFIIKGGVGISLLALPLVSSAQRVGREIETFVQSISSFINQTLVPLVFAIAFLVFIWGVMKYFIFSGGSEEGKEQGKSLMLWGIIGFFLMVAIWGIVNLLVSGTGLEQQNLEGIPNAPVRQN